MTCKHLATHLSYNKMFITDNGELNGQTIEILLDCECGATLFVYNHRGNVPKEYIHKRNSLNTSYSKGTYIEGGEVNHW